MYLSKRPFKFSPNFPLLFFISLASFPVLSIRARSIFIVICVLSYLYPIFSKPLKLNVKPFLKLHALYPLLPVLLFFLYTASYFYSTNKEVASFALEKRLSLLAFPFVAWAGSLLATRRNFKDAVLFVFVFATLTLILKTFIFFDLQQLFSLSAESVKAVTAFRKAIAAVTNLHPTYLSIYFLFSCLILVECLLSLFRKRKSYHFLKCTLYLLLITVFLTAGFITAARTPLISFILTLIVRLLISKNSLLTKLVFVLLLGSAVSVATVNIPSLNHRVQEVFKTSFKPPEGLRYNSTNLRVGIYICSAKAIQRNWLWGAGAGDSQVELNACLEQFNTPVYKQFNYNTHNQYFGVWLDVGFLGLLTLLAIMLSGIYYGFIKKNSLQISFFIFMALNMLTENILATQAGIVFFMYFYAFFFFHLEKAPTKEVVRTTS
jgi:O-antigen ligase